MSTKAKIISAYFAIAVLVALYLSIWGTLAYRGVAYNAGRALFWPLVIFPGAGVVVGGLIMVAVVIAVVVLSRGRAQ